MRCHVLADTVPWFIVILKEVENLEQVKALEELEEIESNESADDAAVRG